MKRIKIYVIGAALALAMAVPFVNAQDRGGLSLAASGADSQRAAMRSKQDKMEAIRTNRDDAIRDMVYRLIPPNAATIERYQFEQMLRQADTGTLLRVSQTWEFEQARAILMQRAGSDRNAPEALGGSKAIGDIDQDYVYTAVPPCRITDTRPAAGGIGILNANTTMDVFVWGDGATIGAQGGNPAGCPSPRGEPRAVHINATVVPTGGGFLTVYPANLVTVPLVSLVNYQPDGTPIANAGIIQTNFDLVGEELRVYTSRNTHVILDVLGYFHEVDAIDPSLLAAASTPPSNVVGTMEVCARNTTTGDILVPGPYQDWTSFCFHSTGLDDSRGVSTSVLWNGLPPATYEFGMCGWQGNDGACGFNVDPQPYREHGSKVTVVITDSLGDSTILHAGYDLSVIDFSINNGRIVEDTGSGNDPAFLNVTTFGQGNSIATIGAGDTVLIQGTVQVHACDENAFGPGDCDFPAAPPPP